MGGKSGPSAPSAPDPAATSRAQTASNKETALYQAQLNMMNQSTPGGSLTYNQAGTWADGTPRFEANQQLAPELKKFYDAAQNTANNQMSAVQGSLSRPFNTTNATFNQGDYLRNNPDVAAAIKRGEFKDARHHYDLYGQNEARQGSGEMVRTIGTDGLPGLVSSASARNPIRYDIANAGNIQRNIADAGNIQRDLDFSRYGDPNVSRNSVESALLSRINPQIDRDRAALETRLANQGIGIGSQAYNDAIDETNRQSTDARMAAILGAGQEQNRLQQLALGEGGFRNQAQGQQFGQNVAQGEFGNAAQAQQYGQNANDAGFWNQANQQDFGQSLSNANLSNQARAQGFNERLTSANFQNTARQNQINEALMQRQLPLNEMSALISGGGVNVPGYINTPQTGVQGTDVAGPQALAYQAQQNAYNQRMQSNNAAMGGLFGLGGALGSGYLAGGGRFW